jgi:ribosomal protein L37AE/L43A
MSKGVRRNTKEHERNVKEYEEMQRNTKKCEECDENVKCRKVALR